MTETKKPWYECYEKKEYKGISYNMYDVTPKKAEEKIIAFIDKIGYSVREEGNISILTEGSKAVLIDIWVYRNFVTNDDFVYYEDSKISTHLIINRKKDSKGRYGYRIRHSI